MLGRGPRGVRPTVRPSASLGLVASTVLMTIETAAQSTVTVWRNFQSASGKNVVAAGGAGAAAAPPDAPLEPAARPPFLAPPERAPTSLASRAPSRGWHGNRPRILASICAAAVDGSALGSRAHTKAVATAAAKAPVSQCMITRAGASCSPPPSLLARGPATRRGQPPHRI